MLNNKIAEGLTAIPELVESYRGDFDKIKELAGKVPDRSAYEKSMAKVEGYLDNIMTRIHNKDWYILPLFFSGRSHTTAYGGHPRVCRL